MKIDLPKAVGRFEPLLDSVVSNLLLYGFISQIMTFTDTALEKFYLFTKLFLRQLPYEQQALPLEVLEMIDLDKYRVQEEQSGRIVLAQEDAALEPTRDDGHRGKKEEKTTLMIF